MSTELEWYSGPAIPVQCAVVPCLRCFTVELPGYDTVSAAVPIAGGLVGTDAMARVSGDHWSVTLPNAVELSTDCGTPESGCQGLWLSASDGAKVYASPVLLDSIAHKYRYHIGTDVPLSSVEPGDYLLTISKSSICLPCLSAADPGYTYCQIKALSMPWVQATALGGDTWTATGTIAGHSFLVTTICGGTDPGCQAVRITQLDGQGGCGWMVPVSYDAPSNTWTWSSSAGLTPDWPGGNVLVQLAATAPACQFCIGPTDIHLTASGFAGPAKYAAANGTFLLPYSPTSGVPCRWIMPANANGDGWSVAYYNLSGNAFWCQFWHYSSSFSYWIGKLTAFDCHGSNTFPNVQTDGHAGVTYPSSVLVAP